MKEVFTADTYHELSSQIDSFMEDHDVYGYDNVTIIIEKVPEPNTDGEYHWKATLVPKDTANAMKDLLVEEHGVVGLFWSKTDIQDWATPRYRTLTDDELEKVAHSLARTDCEYGISWQVIDDTITNLIDFDSDPDEACERDRERHGTDGYENEGDESDELRDNLNDWTDTEMIGV